MRPSGSELFTQMGVIRKRTMNRKIVDKLDREIEESAFKVAVVATTGRAVSGWQGYLRTAYCQIVQGVLARRPDLGYTSKV